jgi:hypothetical protein
VSNSSASTTCAENLASLAKLTATAAATDQLQLLARNRKVVDAAHDFNHRLQETLAKARFGAAWPEATASPVDQAGSDEGEEMQTYVDSPVTNNYYQQAIAPSSPAEAAPQSSGLSTIGKAAAVAALLAGGAGSGLAAQRALDWFRKPAAPAVSTATPEAAIGVRVTTEAPTTSTTTTTSK